MSMKRCKQEILPQVVKVLDLIADCKNSASDDVYRKHTKYRGVKQMNMGRDFSVVAKNCLTTHRYAAAATMLSIVCQELSMVDLFFFKAVCIVLENDPTTTGEEFFNFIRLVRCLCYVNKHEVILEYLIYVLRTNDLDGHHHLKVLLSQQRKTGRNFIIDPLVKAYMGMFDYIEWSRSCHNPAQEESVKSAEKAIECFKEAIEIPGQWDIFVLKLVEMLEFYGNLTDAEAVLTKYAEVNPEHINSHIYLCTFLQRVNPTSEKLISHLKVIAEQCPSDSHVLLLVEMLMDSRPKKSLKLLFMFLDYPSNSEELKAWELMSNLLIQMGQNSVPSQIKAIKSYWAERSEIWPYVHFDVQKLSIQNKKCAKVPFQKAIVLCSVERINHPYVKAVLHSLETVSGKLCNKLRTKLNEVDNVYSSILCDDDDDHSMYVS